MKFVHNCNIMIHIELYFGGFARKGLLKEMKKSIFTKNNKKLSQEKCEEWYRMVVSISWKLWLLTLVCALFLFIFFKPNEECSKAFYFYLFVTRPTLGQGAVALVFGILLKLCVPTRSQRLMSLCTMAEVSLFAAIAAWVHTSVPFMAVVLFFPMMLTPLYRDKLMTIVQFIIIALLYIADRLYFIPNSPYMPPGSELIDVTIFFGSAIVVFILIEQVNVSFILQDEKAARDSLTHLYNHETFYEELEYYMKNYEERKATFSVLIADIDNFKKVNDTYGHAFGDDVIREVVAAMERSRDKNNFCARYGGEEFAMILPGKNIHEAGEIAESLRREFENTEFETGGGKCHFTLSIGVAEYVSGYERASQFFEEADKALYCAKRTGKNKVCFADRKIDSEAEGCES